MARRWLGLGAMTAVSLVVAHNLVFLLADGANAEAALASTGHGDAWRMAVAIVLLAGAGLLLIAVLQLHRLGILAQDLDRSEGGLDPLPGPFGRDVVGLWLRLTVATAVLFAVQENVEHLQAGLGLPGLAVLGSGDYANALLVIAAVALAVALVAGLLGWRRGILLARIADAARRRWHRPLPARPRRAAALDRRPNGFFRRSSSVRAPPRLLTAPTPA